MTKSPCAFYAQELKNKSSVRMKTFSAANSRVRTFFITKLCSIFEALKWGTLMMQGGISCGHTYDRPISGVTSKTNSFLPVPASYCIPDTRLKVAIICSSTWWPLPSSPHIYYQETSWEMSHGPNSVRSIKQDRYPPNRATAYTIDILVISLSWMD